jgi:dolichol-phosphate mannosyltransferase
MVSEATLEFVIPVYNELECLDELVRRLMGVRERGAALGVEISCIFVDDGSRDGSLQKLLAISEARPALRVIGLSRNFGHQIAVTAGLDAVTADYACIIDADLQDPPELLLDMYAEMRRSQVNVVYAQRRQRAGESQFKAMSATAFYRLLRKMCRVDIPPDTGDFRLLDRKVIDALQQMRERHRFLRGLIPWVGFKSAPLLYDRNPRYAGVTKYPFRKMVRLAADAMLSFSNMPLRVAAYSGFVVAAGGFLLLFYVLLLKLFTDIVVPGLTVILASVLVIGGFQTMILGVIGEYIGRIFEEVKERPLYFVDVTRNLPPPRAIRSPRMDSATPGG